MLRLRWLFFDLGDTIWRSSTPESRRAAGLYDRAAERIGAWLRAQGYAPPADCAALAARLWDEVDAAGKRAEAASAVSADAGAVARQVLEAVGVSVSLEEAQTLWRLSTQVPAPERGITLLPGAAETLDALARRNLRLGIITNRSFGEAHTRRDLAALGLEGYFDQVIVSADVGYLKPHPRIFQAALAAARARPQDCAVVGDSLRADVQGAQDSGLRAIWLRSPRNVSDRPLTPDATIERLSDLLDLVRPLD